MTLQTTLDFLYGLCNLPDLILLGFLLFSVSMGASRGPTRALIALATRLGSLIASFYAARACAPVLAHWIVTPIVGDIFEERAALSGTLLVEEITETAVQMAEGIAFLILLLLCVIGLGVLFHLLGDALHLIGRLPPFGFVGRLAGMGIGLIGGVLLAVLTLWLIGVFRPDIYAPLGYLSPENLANTTLVSALLGFFPVAP
ncbi:MAG: CvpA family protein [Butyricicoccus sp.]|nr:CvpA family protein [Butyricicoccus sp.]